MKMLVTGNAGFIGSHLADYLLEQGHEVVGIDNLSSSDGKNIAKGVKFYQVSICNYLSIEKIFENEKPDIVFHLAAVARTPSCVNDPLYAHEVNVTGTLNVLLAARLVNVKRVVFASSNIVYAAETPYRTSKLAGESYCKVFNELYGVPTVSLRFSNVYGSIRQSEKGDDINVLAALKRSKREKGYIEITGDGEQSRDFTHVLDIVQGIYKAAFAECTGKEIDLCTGRNFTMNQIADFFNCKVMYVPDRKGDCKHITQSPAQAFWLLGWKAILKLEDNISIYANEEIK